MLDVPSAQATISNAARRVVKARSSVRQQGRKRTLSPSSMFLQKSLSEEAKKSDFLDIIRDFQSKSTRVSVDTEVHTLQGI